MMMFNTQEEIGEIEIKFKILPEDSYGSKKTNDTYFYHAINVGHGTQVKVAAMKNALQEFEQFR